MKELGKPEFGGLGKTVGLLLRMLKTYFNMCRYGILDSGFCVLKALVELRGKGLFGCALIKKRRYWPTSVPGEAMEANFADKEVGHVDVIMGRAKTHDDKDVWYTLWGMKEPEYVTCMMATGGTLEADDSCRTTTAQRVNGTTKFFQYTKPSTTTTTCAMLCPVWKTRGPPPGGQSASSPSFLPLAISKVNCYLILKFSCYVGDFSCCLPKYHKFREELAWALIDNPECPIELSEED